MQKQKIVLILLACALRSFSAQASTSPETFRAWMSRHQLESEIPALNRFFGRFAPEKSLQSMWSIPVTEKLCDQTKLHHEHHPSGCFAISPSGKLGFSFNDPRDPLILATIYHEVTHALRHLVDPHGASPDWFEEALARIIEREALQIYWDQSEASIKNAGYLSGFDAQDALDRDHAYFMASSFLQHLATKEFVSIKTILKDALSPDGFQKVLTRLRVDQNSGSSLSDAYEAFLVRWISLTPKDWKPGGERAKYIQLKKYGFRIWELEGKQACLLQLNLRSRVWSFKSEEEPQPWLATHNDCGNEAVRLLEIADTSP